MIKILTHKKICITSFIMALLFLSIANNSALPSVGPSYIKAIASSKINLKKYFEEAMVLFESGKYKEAVILFEKLIEVEKSQGEAYFTPFAEIYIDKSKSRMSELMLLEEKKWEKVKKDVVEEEAQRIAREEKETIIQLKSMKEKEKEIANEGEGYELEEHAQNIYENALMYYRERNYPLAIVEFKKIREIDPNNALVSQAEYYIQDARKRIKKEEEKLLLVRMKEAGRANIQMQLEERERRIEHERKEREKVALKRIFEQRLRQKDVQERVTMIAGFMDSIIANVTDRKFDEAENVLNKAIAEFPESERFKEILHYVNLQKIKMEEDALKKARELTEEKMLLDVAKAHIMPEEKIAVLDKEKKITPLVKIPEIRKRLKIPISVDFKDVELDYVLSFLSDATGVNIVPSTQIDMGEKKVSMKIKDMALEEALRYILKSQDLLYRIEEDAVWVATKDEMDKEKIDTRVYFLNQGIGRFAEFSATDSASKEDVRAMASETKASSSVSSETKTIKNILENAVDWPKDSKLTLDNRTSALIISNSPSNLETIENLLYNLDITPKQVLIEARFLEVKVTDLDELGIEWKLNSAWGVDQNNRKQDIHGFAANSGVDFLGFGDHSDEGFNLTYRGVLSHPQFQAVIHALQEKKNVKTLSAPRISTLNNQAATIEVIEEYVYPTRYESSLVQYDINGDGDFDDAGETEWANIPQDFVTRDVGILLHVKPSIGVDNKTITLALTPEVSEASGSYTYSGNVTIPKFTTRNLSTSVIIKDGETIVLGGLIKETRTHVVTKVPLLGDLPLLGGLFRKNTDDIERRNLLIFVTATILDKEKEAVDSVEKEETGQKQ